MTRLTGSRPAAWRGVLLGALLVAAAVPRPALADEPEKKAAAADADTPADALGYPPFSTRFKVLTAGVLVSGLGWGVAYAAARGWPENVCHQTVAGYLDVHKQPCTSGPPGSAQLGIPIVGPWIMLGRAAAVASDEASYPAGIVAVRSIALVLDGIVQAAGVGLVLESLIMKTEPLASNKKTSAFALHYRGVELQPLPLASPSLTGIGVVGTF